MADLPPLESPNFQRHLRQRFWHILAPIILTALLVIAGGVFTIGAEAGQTRFWADVAVIWLITPLMGFALPCLAVLVGLIYALTRLMKITPLYTARAQNLAARVESRARQAADVTVKPVLWLEQFSAAVRSIFRM